MIVFFTVAVSIAKAQGDYSESARYVPRDLSQLIPQKKGKKKQSPPPNVGVPGAPTVSSSISIPISVLDPKGVRIPNLKKEDFKVFIGDKEAEIKSFAWTTGPMNVVLLIDASPSAAHKPQEVQQITSLLVDQFVPEDKIMLAEFSDRLNVLTDFTTDRDVLRKAIGKFPAGDGTSLYDSVAKLFSDRILTANSNTVVVLVTDGVDTTSFKQDYAGSISAVEGSQMSVFPIYLDTLSANAQPAMPAPGSWQAVFANIPGVYVPQPRYQAQDMTKAYEVGQLYLSDLVFATGGTAFTVPGFRATPAEIAKHIHERYFITVQPSDSLVSELRYPVRVRVNIPNVAVIARGSYIAK
ncbi:MAG: VWA domain-containing protein [Acidobacteriota bacterium]